MRRLRYTMAAPPQGPGQMPQQYPGMYYQPMTLESQLTHRNVFFANALGLLMIWFAYILRIVSTDPNLLKLDVFLVITGALLAALANVAAALASKKTSDMQNVGLFIWSGFLVTAAAYLLAALGVL